MTGDTAGRPLEILAVAGSLRRGSFNRALLRAARELAPAALEIRVHDLAGVPLFSEDFEPHEVPAAVTRLREAVAAADGLLVASPEYNYGLPAVTKNAVDWLSRPLGTHALNGKPAAIIGASPAATGTARAQAQLRQAFVVTNTLVLTQPEVMVGRAHEKFDAEGRLTDPAAREALARLLEAFAGWIGRLAERPAMAAVS